MRTATLRLGALFMLCTLAAFSGACDSGNSSSDNDVEGQQDVLSDDSEGTADTNPEPDQAQPDQGSDDSTDNNDLQGQDQGEDPEDIAVEPDESVAPLDEYPPAPYGTVTNSIIRNHKFVDPATNTVMKLSDMYKSPDKKVLFISSGAGWCSVCKAEAYTLRSLYTNYKDKGLEIWYTLFEDYDAKPAEKGFWSKWMNSINPNYPTLLDNTFQMGLYFNVSATPMNMLIDTSTMEIIYLQTGYDETGIENMIKQMLGL